MANIKFKKSVDNETKEILYDIYAENGSLAITKGMESQIYMSLLNNKRASNSQVLIRELQQGWLGNNIISDVNNTPDYEIGSLLWLVIEQSNITNVNLEKIKSYARDSLNWLIEDNYCTLIKVEASFGGNVVFLDITLVINQNNIIKKRYNLWLNTFENN
jgi:phage gp46-like protein